MVSTSLIFVDESGDLGWSFEKPFGKGGSSRYLTIAAMIIPLEASHLPERKVRHLYNQGKWDTKREKKWVEMSDKSRMIFAKSAIALKDKHPVKYKAIVVKKENVNESFRKDSNKLYNYMLRLLLLEEMASHEDVVLIPDPRSIKVENGKSLHHYLEMMLYEIEAPTKLETITTDSKSSLNLQFVDMLAGAIWTEYEYNKSFPWTVISTHVDVKTLFFS